MTQRLRFQRLALSGKLAVSEIKQVLGEAVHAEPWFRNRYVRDGQIWRKEVVNDLSIFPLEIRQDSEPEGVVIIEGLQQLDLLRERQPLFHFLCFPDSSLWLAIHGIVPAVDFQDICKVLGRVLQRRENASLQDYPPSRAQRVLWRSFIAKGLSLNVPLVLRIREPLSIGRIEAVTNILSARHDILRTTYSGDVSYPECAVAPKRICPIEFHDLTGLSESERVQENSRILSMAVTQFIDLTVSPWRLVVTKSAKDDWRLAFVFAHISIDGWSRYQLAEEIRKFLESNDPLRIDWSIPGKSYEDYSRFEQMIDQSYEYHRRAIRFFRGYPADMGALPLSLSETDEERSLVRKVPQQTAVSIYECTKRLGVTPFMLTLTAYLLALTSWKGRSVCGLRTSLLNRPHPDFMDTIGCFTNTLFIVFRLPGTWRASELVEQVRDQVLRILENEDIAIDDVLDLAEEEGRSDEFRALLNISFNFHESQVSRRPYLRMQEEYAGPSGRRYPIRLVLDRDAAGDLAASLSHLSGVVPNGEAWLDHYFRCLHQVCDLSTETSQLLGPASEARP